MRFAERMMLSRRAVAARRGDAKSSHSAKGIFGHSRFGVESVLDLQRTHGNAFVQRLVRHKLAISIPVDRDEKEANGVAGAVVRNQYAGSSMQAISHQAEHGVRGMCPEWDDEMQRGSPSTNGVIARQPKPSPGPGWSDAPAPKKGLNELVTTVDEKGNIVPGKGASKGVWRVPIEGLGIGYLPKKGEQGPAFESPKGKAVALIPNIVTPTAPEKEKTVQVDVLLHLHGRGVGYRELQPGKQDPPPVF